MFNPIEFNAIPLEFKSINCCITSSGLSFLLFFSAAVAVATTVAVMTVAAVSSAETTIAVSGLSFYYFSAVTDVEMETVF